LTADCTNVEPCASSSCQVVLPRDLNVTGFIYPECPGNGSESTTTSGGFRAGIIGIATTALLSLISFWFGNIG
jgi:hypothetical protein